MNKKGKDVSEAIGIRDFATDEACDRVARGEGETLFGTMAYSATLLPEPDGKYTAVWDELGFDLRSHLYSSRDEAVKVLEELRNQPLGFIPQAIG